MESESPPDLCAFAPLRAASIHRMQHEGDATQRNDEENDAKRYIADEAVRNLIRVHPTPARRSPSMPINAMQRATIADATDWCRNRCERLHRPGSAGCPRRHQELT